MAQEWACKAPERSGNAACRVAQVGVRNALRMDYGAQNAQKRKKPALEAGNSEVATG
jgi:hypothetical protein